MTAIANGSKVTNAPYDADGVVRVDPDELATAAGCSLDEYALARMIASEEGGSDTGTKIAVAWATFNEADRRGTSISAMLLHALNSDHSGYFGTQKDLATGKSDRYASTALDPHAGDVQIAQGVLGQTIPDPTGGANQFDRPAGEKNPDAIAASRLKTSEPVTVASADPGLRFWRVRG